MLLAKGMRAAALRSRTRRGLSAPGRALPRAAVRGGCGRARRRRAGSRSRRPSLRRRRVRDAVLLLGRDPAAWPNAALALAHLPITPGAGEVRLLDEDPCEELDGIGARAARYRAELDRGRWRLPHDWPSAPARHDPSPTPEEATRR